MVKPAFDTGPSKPYAPPSGPPRLFSIYCDTCAAACFCGEKNTGSACGDPSEYDEEDFHPARTPNVNRPGQLDLPPPIIQSPITLPPGIVIAKAFLSGQAGRVAVHGDRLTGRRFQRVKNGLACLVAEDPIIKKLWDRRARLGKRLAAAGFTTAIAPAYSTYWGSSPFDGHVAVRWSAEMAAHLSRSVSVVPTIAWRTEADLQRWAHWIESGSLSCIAIHLSKSTRREWDWMVQAVDILAGLFAVPPHLLVIGPSTLPRIRRVADLWPSGLSVASTKPWLLAQHGRALNLDLSSSHVPRNIPTTQIAERNARIFAAVATDIVRNPQHALVQAG